MNDQITTLAELIRISYPQDLNWLADGPTKNDRVNWIVTHIDDLEEFDILVLGASELDSEIVKQTRNRGAVGIILINDCVPDDQTINHNFPIAAIKGTQTIREVQKRLQNIILNQRSFLLERSLQIHAHLLKMAAEGRGLPNLIKTLSDLSGRGVVLQNKRSEILADFPTSSLIQIWDNILDRKSVV